MLEKAILNFAGRFNLRAPTIIQAPMAGGLTTPNLVAAVANYGGLGSLATGYLSPDKVQQAIKATRALTDKPFAANVFIPPAKIAFDSSKIAPYQLKLNQYRRALQLQEQDPVQPLVLPPDYFNDIMDILVQEKIAIVSFTFGMLSKEYIKKLHSQGIYLIGTATSLAEAQALEQAGIDAVVAQGSEAGGHRGGFFDNQPLTKTLDLVTAMAQQSKIPIIAAGGIMTARQILLALECGASAVQIGTAFIPLDESGANACYKSAILAAQQAKAVTPTTITSHYSGKPARGLRTSFTEELAQSGLSIPDYPIPHYLTQAIRQAAAQQNNKELMSLWCGEGIDKLNPHYKTVEALLQGLWQEIEYRDKPSCF